MILEHLALANFRNYASASLDLHALGNLIIAPNGAGKTNLLEAIAYCGLGKSIRFHRDLELLREGAGFFTVKGDFRQDLGLELSLQLSWQEGVKLLKINALPVRQLSRVYECVKVIYCAPEDMNLVGGNPRFRRQYFDLAISQIYPAYITVLRAYLHIVEQRNNLLKRDYQAGEKQSWDLRYAIALLEVLSYRKQYLELLNQAFNGQYLRISELVRDIRLNYLVQNQREYPTDPEQMVRILKDHESREKRYQRSLLGAHLDDYEFLLSGHNLRTFGSQGQKRITVIVLKLIQAALIEKITQIKPILLFDDVFAELDSLHSHCIRDFVDYRYQVFVASPREEMASEWSGLQRLSLPGCSA